MKRVVEVVCIFLFFLLQSTLFQHISFAGIVPNLMIIATSAFGFLEGRTDGMCVGFVCGLLTDIFYGSLLGLNALIYLYIGYANGAANRGFYPDDIKFPLLFISASDLVYLMLTYCTGFLLRARFDLGYYFTRLMIPELIYTIALSLLIYLPLRRVFVRIERRREEDS